MIFKHKKGITSLSLLLCFCFLIGSLLTSTVQAQSAGIVISTNNSWNGSNSVELGPNLFGQVIFKFTPSQTCTLNTIGFYAKGDTAGVNIYLASGNSWSAGTPLAHAVATLRTGSNYVMQWEYADFSSSNLVLSTSNTYLVSVTIVASQLPIFLFSNQQLIGNTWNNTGAGGVINDLFYEVRGTPYSGSNPTPTPYGNNPTPTPYNNYPTPTPYNGNPTPSPYTFPTQTQEPTYIMGYGFSSTDLIIIIVVIAIIMGCAVFVSINLNKSNRPRKKHK